MAISQFRDGMRFIRKLNLYKLGNAAKVYLAFWVSVVLRRPLVWGLPFSVSVEPTNLCNLSCRECSTGSGKLSREKGYLKMEIFLDILRQLRKELMYLNFSFQGEPFMHPQLPELIREAGVSGIYTSCFSNGHFLTPEVITAILSAGLDRIVIPVDGTDQASYSAYRTGGDLDKVLDGIRELINVRSSLKASKPFIILQFLVLKSNEHQINEIKALGKKLGVDRVVLKKAQIIHPESELLPLQSRYSRYHKDIKGQIRLKLRAKPRCLRLFTTAVMTWDGKLAACCFDKDAKYAFGDLRYETFTMAWRSNRAWKLKRMVIAGRKEVDICSNCPE